MFTLPKKKKNVAEFQVKLIENLISKHHITEERPLGRPPETAHSDKDECTSLSLLHCCHNIRAKSVTVLCYALQNGSTL
jgi:hypothetical protein